MTARLLILLASLALLVAPGLPATGAANGAAPAAPSNLRIIDGADAWHAENDFRLGWDEPPGPVAPIAAIHYRVRDEAGTVVSGTRIPWYTNRIDRPQLPPRPGHYTAEVWFENALGEPGPTASASLHFDDASPSVVEPLLPAGWIGAGPAPLLRLTHPAAPLPISGIRGYAVSLDPVPSAFPCQAPSRCSSAETDLRGGVGGDSMQLERLPEGTTYVHTVAVSGAGVASAVVGTELVRVDTTPPDVELHGAPSGWVGHAVEVTAVAADLRSGMGGSGSAGPVTALSVDGAMPAVASGHRASTVVAAEGVHTVAYYARDAAGNVSGGASAPPSRLVRIDRSPPQVAFAASLDPSDPELLEAQVSDGLSAPDPSRGSIAIRPARSHRQFSLLPTTVAGNRLLARWDSDRYPPGSYEFRAIGYDSAGNVASSQRRVNGTALVLPAPLKAPTRLRAGFGGRQLVWHRCVKVELQRQCRRKVVESFERRPATRVVPYGKGVAVGGLLTTAAGISLAGLPVQVIETFDDSRPDRHVQTVETAADGSFFSRLAPGPSRRIEFVFAGTRTLAGAAGRVTGLAVQAGVRMRASSSTAAIGGRPVVFSGTVEDGEAIPPQGKAVELQFRLPGLPWTQFRTIQTDSRGRFRHPYRFSDDDSRGVRFHLRAFVPAEEGWPYEPAASRPVTVTGR
ncbi:MAG TPA: hypothetical protein VGO66_01945 [Solirubrobacterales bacterium]|jgi:hypothetical protein|nr:hypothetical protein [Solirubrobacterales bacterium]